MTAKAHEVLFHPATPSGADEIVYVLDQYLGARDAVRQALAPKFIEDQARDWLVATLRKHLG